MNQTELKVLNGQLVLRVRKRATVNGCQARENKQQATLAKGGKHAIGHKGRKYLSEQITA